MASKKRGLSRGLDVLLKDTLGADMTVAVAVADATTKTKSKATSVLAEKKVPPQKPVKKVLKKTTTKPAAKKTTSKKVTPTKEPTKPNVAEKGMPNSEESPSLVEQVIPVEPAEAEEPEKVIIKGLDFIDVTQLSPGRYQPRKEILESELESLADSIRTQGVLQPIVVRPPTADGRYEIIAGERRFRASRLAGLKEVPAIIKDVSDEAAMAIALIENIQRENLNPVEEAEALDRLAKTYELSHSEVAEAVGKSRTSVTNLLRLLNLNDDVRLLLERGDIDMGHAKVLLGVQGHLQSTLARAVVNQGLSVRETEKLLARSQMNEPPAAFKQPVDPDISRLQMTLSEKVGAPVKILHNNRGKGRVVIRYNSLDELDGILAHIQ